MSDAFNHIEFSVIDQSQLRLDQLLGQLLLMSRQQAKGLITGGHVIVNGNVQTKPARMLAARASVIVKLPMSRRDRQVSCVHHYGRELINDRYNIPILFEDDDVMVINKPYGLVVHAGAGIDQVSLMDYICAAGVPLAPAQHEHRWGIVHRLDQYTEGVLAIAKTAQAMTALQQQFRDRSITKKYYAVLAGVLSVDAGEIDRPIGRDRRIRARQSVQNFVDGTQKSALTRFWVLRRLTNLTLVDIELVTGRTHQIRVHFASKSVPVFGDSLYSNQQPRDEGYYLQSYELGFDHPITMERVTVSLPMSDRLKQYAEH